MRKSNQKMARKAKSISIGDALRLAISVHQGGQPRLAAQHYRAILEVEPGHPDALHYLGVAQHQLGDREAAVRLISRALEIAPDYVDARNNLGNVQQEMGQYAAAEQAYRAVLEARPDFVLALNNLGVVLKEQERYDDAITAYRQAVTLAPDFAQGWLNLGNVLKKSGALQDALTAYRNAIMLKPENVEAYRNLGRALVAHHRHDEALEVYRQWQKIEPDNPVVIHLIAACKGAEAPQRASDAFLQKTFDGFADSFDEVLTRLAYRAPGLCGELVEALLGAPAQNLEVLDAGCGTGLCGPFLRPYARRLSGVDLSAGMLAKAGARGGYDQLAEAELTAWLASHPAAYELVVSADTLCYFGALEDAMRAAACALQPGGHLVFTVEETTDPASAPQFLLHPHGRYSHTEAYVRRCVEAAGLEVAQVRHVALRLEAKVPVGGLLVGAKKPAAV